MKKSSLYLKIAFVTLVVSNFFIVNIAFNQVINSFYKENIKNVNKLLYVNLKEHVIKNEEAALRNELQFLIDYEFAEKIVLNDLVNNNQYLKREKEDEVWNTHEKYDFYNGKELIAQLEIYYNDTMAEKISQHFKQKIFLYKFIVFIITFATIYLLLKNVEKNYFDRVKAELRFKKEKEKAERANAAKGEFLAKMSHELKTPLNGITTITDILLYNKRNSKDLEYLKIIKNSSKTLLGLLNNILNLSKLEKGIGFISKDNFNIREVLDESVELCYINKGKTVLITTDISDKVPEVLIGDSDKLKQILINILSNSTKFTHNGYINIKVNTSNNNSGYYDFIIEDSGIGISSNQQDEIFENFNQGNENISRIYGGTGLGLAIVKNILSFMDGTIELKSTLGKGTKVVVSLPFESKKDFSINLKKECLLMVDSRAERISIEKTLSTYKIPFISIDTPEEGLEILDDWTNNAIDFYLIVDFESIKDKDIAYYIKSNDKIISNTILLYDFFSNLEEVDDKYNGIKFMLKPFSINKLIKLDAERVFLKNENFIGKILLVEDNLINIIGTKGMLEGQGLEVDIAKSIKESQSFLRNSYDIILLDIQLPDGNGFELAKQLRSMGNETPIIALSAHDTKVYESKAIESGMDQFIPKPLDYSSLRTLLKKYLKVEDIEEKGVIDDELIDIFWKQYEEVRRNLNVHIENGNKVEVLKLIHKLKGSIGNFDANQIYNEISEIELRAKAHLDKGLFDELDRVEVLLRRKLRVV